MELFLSEEQVDMVENWWSDLPDQDIEVEALAVDLVGELVAILRKR